MFTLPRVAVCLFSSNSRCNKNITHQQTHLKPSLTQQKSYTRPPRQLFSPLHSLHGRVNWALTMSTPLSPLSANSNKLPVSPTPDSKPDIALVTPNSPSNLTQQTPNSPMTSVKKPTPTNSPSRNNITPQKVAPSSPFVDFSPIAQPARGSRTSSPVKLNSSSKLSFDDNFDPFDEEIEHSVSSNFSEVTTTVYNAVQNTTQGLDQMLQENIRATVKSPAKAPQTPSRRSPTKTPVTARIYATPSASSARNKTPGSTTPTARKPATSTARKNSIGSNALLSSPRSPINDADKTQNLLLDFTTQFDAASRQNKTPGHRRIQSASPKKSSTKTALPPATPTETRFFNLLDFTPGPTQTPRSIPSITPREVEELKADFNSQISTLKAQLGGREVEVDTLRKAVAETEARCAELSHMLQEAGERFENERNEWNKIKEELKELFEAEKAEKNSISSLLQAKEQTVEELHIELESVGAEVGNLKKRLRDQEDELERTKEEVKRVRTEVVPVPAAPAVPLPAGAISEEDAARKTAEEVERVARELHTLYKAKHEQKVAALKKSYEGRWEKKVSSLEQQVAQLTKKNEELVAKLADKSSDDKHEEFGEVKLSSGGAEEDLRREVQKLQEELRNEQEEKMGILGLAEELIAIQANLEKRREEERRSQTPKATERPERSTERPVEKPSQKSTVAEPMDVDMDSPIDKAADALLDEPMETPEEKPAETPAEKPVDAPIEKPAVKPVEKLVPKLTARPTSRPPVKPAAAAGATGEKKLAAPRPALRGEIAKMRALKMRELAAAKENAGDDATSFVV